MKKIKTSPQKPKKKRKAIGVNLRGINRVKADRLLQRAIHRFQLGRLEETADLCNLVLTVNPANAEALHLLGVITYQQGNLHEAAQFVEKAITLKPDDESFHNNLGIIYRDLKLPNKALIHYRLALQLKPSFAEAYNNLGVVFQDLDQSHEAIDCFQKAIARKATYCDAYNNLGTELGKVGRITEGLEFLEKALNLTQSPASILNNIAKIYIDQGEFGQAERLLQEAVTLAPEYPEIYSNFALIAERLGDFDLATEFYRNALTLQPSSADTLFQLTKIIKYTSLEDSDLKQINALLSQTNLLKKEKILLHFATAKIYDDCRAYDSAFQNYKEANTLKFPGFDKDIHNTLCDSIIAAYHSEFFAESYDETPLIGREPIFIIGMPRSGTTLVEQIIASHPDVAAGGELTFIRDLIDAPGQPSSYPQNVNGFTREDWLALQKHYLTGINKIAGSRKHVTDKFPQNFFFLGAIRKAFPNAPIIHCRRNPVDVCLSCYFQNFETVQAFSFDLEALAQYYNAYLHLMAHWSEVLPKPMFEVEYEDIVTNPETVIPRIIAHCNLPWDPRCLTPHKRKGAVSTASSWQTRQPIYTGSIARWQNYRPYIRSLLDLLDIPAGEI